MVTSKLDNDIARRAGQALLGAGVAAVLVLGAGERRDSVVTAELASMHLVAVAQDVRVAVSHLMTGADSLIAAHLKRL